MALRNRHGETGPIPFRTLRVFNIGEHWYFATRECQEQGPYTEKDLAEQALRNYLNAVLSLAHERADLTYNNEVAV